MHKNQTTDMAAEVKSCGLVKTAARSLAGFRALALFLVLFLSTSSFAAIDFSALTDGISAEIEGMVTALGPVATAMIGLSLFVGLALLIKRFARNPG